MTQPGDASRQELFAQLADIRTARGRASFLRRHRELWQPAVVEALYAEVVRLASTDLHQAKRLAAAASWLALKLDDDGLRAQSLRAVGHVESSLGKYEEALSHYQEALAIFRKLGRAMDVARTLNGALQCLHLLGRYEEAYRTSEQARALFEQQGNVLGIARLDTNVANMLFRQDRFDDALDLYKRAESQFAVAGNPQDVAAALSNMAMVYSNLNEFQLALDTYTRARAHCERHSMPLLVLRADYNIAYLYYLRGEYTKALDLYRQAQEACDALGDRNRSALCDLDRSEMYLEINLSEEAGELGERALACFEQLGMNYEAGKAVTNVAIAASCLGEVGRAMDLFARARVLFGREQNHLWLALVDFYEALVLYRDGQYGPARKMCLKAVALFARAGAPARAGLCELLLARLELHAGDLDAAERACVAAVDRLGDAAPPHLAYQGQLVLGLTREAQGDRESAFAAFRKAHRDLERLRSHLQAEDLKISFLKDKLAVYESLVITCLALAPTPEHKEAAFGYIEGAKSRSLADLIAFRAATLQPRVPNQASEDVRRLRHDLNWHYRQFELEEVSRDKHSAQRMENLRSGAAALEKTLSRSLDELRRTDGEFAAMQSGAAQSLDDIRATLSPGTMLLEYYQARGRYYVCVLGRDQLEILPVADAAKVRHLIALLQFQLSKFRLQPQYLNAFAGPIRAATESHLRDLYTALVAPVRGLIDGAARLVIVPHDILHGLPFHALFDGTRYVIDDFTVSYAPSASVYRLCSIKPPAAVSGALIMGVSDALAPCIDDEVRAVSAMLPGAQVFTGPEATSERLRTHGPSSRFIHLATHGLFRRDNPMFSSVRLGDGPLCVHDLYELQLSAELVTLSGCGTGLNAVVGGDELLGLVRGLLYAGAHSVLLTLWDAYDRSTAEFMQSFYGHLEAGVGKARAAQAATREIREAHPHPFYWAPFTLVGQ